jgi:CelD/BcsL family acetyltransferase involved in cellulose biosynthesis
MVTLGEPDLRVTAVEQGGSTLAAAVVIEHHDTLWMYNTGFEPSAARLAPGMLLNLHSLRVSIERGLRCADFGEGDFVYKRDLGAEPINRVKLDLTSPSSAGRMMRWAYRFRRHAERNPRLRAAALAARRAVLVRSKS